MDITKLIARINVLAQKKRTTGLSETELLEQKALYEKYLNHIRGQVKNHLDNIELVDVNTIKH